MTARVSEPVYSRPKREELVEPPGSRKQQGSGSEGHFLTGLRYSVGATGGAASCRGVVSVTAGCVTAGSPKASSCLHSGLGSTLRNVRGQQVPGSPVAPAAQLCLAGRCRGSLKARHLSLGEGLILPDMQQPVLYVSALAGSVRLPCASEPKGGRPGVSVSGVAAATAPGVSPSDLPLWPGLGPWPRERGSGPA